MGILDDLDSINQNRFQNNKRKHDDTMFEVEYGSFQVLLQIRELLKDNNTLLKNLYTDLQNQNGNGLETTVKRNSGLQNRKES